MSLCASTYRDALSGRTYLIIPTTQPADMSSCAYVVQSGPEVTSSPWLMSRTDAAQLGAAIALLWVTVGVLKTVARRS